MSPIAFRKNERPPADPAEAADWWCARRALAEPTSREESAFAAWIADPRHAAAWANSQAVWEAAATYAGEPEILPLRATALRASPVNIQGKSWRWVAGLTAALVLAGVLVVRGAQPSTPTPPVTDVAEATFPKAKRYETKIGERRDVRLDDGSIVSLNTGSLIEIAYSAARRDVRLLRGQALFHVAHNRNWPFVVTAADRQVTAVGTIFDIRVDGPRVRVVLVEGQVRVDPLQRRGLEKLIPQLAEEHLAAGEQLTATTGVQVVTVANADIQRAVSWRVGQLIFRDDGLAAAAAELNRYSTTQILADPRVGNLKVSGVFNVDRPDDFVAAVTAFYPIHAIQIAPGVTQLSWDGPG